MVVKECFKYNNKCIVFTDPDPEMREVETMTIEGVKYIAIGFDIFVGISGIRTPAVIFDADADIKAGQRVDEVVYRGPIVTHGRLY